MFQPIEAVFPLVQSAVDQTVSGGEVCLSPMVVGGIVAIISSLTAGNIAQWKASQAKEKRMEDRLDKILSQKDKAG